MSEKNLLGALRGVVRGNVSEQELSQLIHSAISTASAILLSRYRRYLPIFRDAGYCLEAAASRCIEDLFLPREEKPCYRLADFLRKQCDVMDDAAEESCEHAFRRVIFLQISQQVPELLGEFDSPYRRILRLVSHCLAHTPSLHKVEGFLEDHYHRCEPDRLLQEKQCMSPDLIVGELFVRTTDTDHVAQLVALVFDILDDQDQYRRMLTQASIVEVIRDFHAMRWEQSSSPDDNRMLFETGDRDRLLEPTVAHVRNTVVRSYMEKEVLDSESASKYLNAVHSMLEDLSKNAILSWFVYYEREFNGHSYEKYREEERGRFEYVMGLAKKNFVHRCKEYFSSD
ncbi:MAG: hypothetical protein RRA94_10890 [Bacteroidota bacterium]|nr:hypothetical protein [Bacteroidota bacterium]